MKNQYFGDVGDYGKYGLLSAVLETELALGINWYLTPNEPEKTDGKYTEYLNDMPEYERCDPELYRFLKAKVSDNKRNVEQIKELPRFTNVPTYNRILDVDAVRVKERFSVRREWFQESMRALQACDIIFMDPDNGVEVKSAPVTNRRSPKYVLYSEIEQLYACGKSLIVYNHRDRSKEIDYIKRITCLKDVLEGTQIILVRFSRFSVRDYIFILQERHEDVIGKTVHRFLESDWGRFVFGIMEMQQCGS
jgi:hypothetical protein